ncbi:unnamed protein product [Anisakis simplex]|uniref:C2H2-type domain-containing protein n=1 Tax=Anisakis simplex TaxID=6269 RepID=A0A0M3J2N8_ANISI|nr:unnamed protein product [Anisakis simplex]
MKSMRNAEEDAKSVLKSLLAGVKKHECSSCGKLFALKSYLNKHIELVCPAQRSTIRLPRSSPLNRIQHHHNDFLDMNHLQLEQSPGAAEHQLGIYSLATSNHCIV